MALTIKDPAILRILTPGQLNGPKPDTRVDDQARQISALQAEITALKAAINSLKREEAQENPMLAMTATIRRDANGKIKTFKLGNTLSTVIRDSTGRMSAINIREENQ
jgi:hypothetical protein